MVNTLGVVDIQGGSRRVGTTSVLTFLKVKHSWWCYHSSQSQNSENSVKIRKYHIYWKKSVSRVTPSKTIHLFNRESRLDIKLFFILLWNSRSFFPSRPVKFLTCCWKCLEYTNFQRGSTRQVRRPWRPKHTSESRNETSWKNLPQRVRGNASLWDAVNLRARKMNYAWIDDTFQGPEISRASPANLRRSFLLFRVFFFKYVRCGESGKCYTPLNSYSYVAKWLWMDPSPVHVRFLVYKVILRQGVIIVLRLSLVSNILSVYR